MRIAISAIPEICSCMRDRICSLIVARSVSTMLTCAGVEKQD